jgi:hypothetical protein
MRKMLLGLATVAALGIVSTANAADKAPLAANAAEKSLPPSVTDETYQIKVVNESGADILVRAVSFNRNWDAIEVKKEGSYTAKDERHYFRKGEKVFAAYDLASHRLIAVKEVEVTGPIVITVSAKDLSAGPLAQK